MIKILVGQGWSKNEIIYEMQRIFGNDILIMTSSLDDERGFLARTIPMLTFGTLAGLLFLK